ncbi:MAG TPA: DUF2846 domain-containing protein [Thiobacillaceae bacterium]|nr:DUF2846 domain-containing protein [Thiobacillaceae bacterium]HNI08063.1 DUF2846 domain-containing protein [Thiobacillaceae bacterium]
MFLLSASRVVCLLTVTLLLGACASGGGGRAESPIALKVGSSKLVVYRESNSTAMFAAPSVIVNGSDIGKLNSGSYIEIPIESGTHTVSFVGNFFNWPWPAKNIQVSISSNSTCFVQLAIYGTNGNFGVLERSAEEASEAMRKLKQ